MPSNGDDELLVRLNALQKSSITLSATPSTSSPTCSATPRARSPTPAAPPQDDILARFTRLGSASPAASPGPKPLLHTPRGEGSPSAPALAPGASSFLEAVAQGVGKGDGDVQFNEEDERSLEELMAELEMGGKGVDRKEEKDLGMLVREIKGLLPDVAKRRNEDRAERKHQGQGRRERNKDEDDVDWENLEVDVGSGGVRVSREDTGERTGDGYEGERKKSVNEEADDVIARIMDELSISKDEENTQGEAQGDQIAFDTHNEDIRREQNFNPSDKSPEERDTLPKLSETDTKKANPDTTAADTPFILPSAPSTLPTQTQTAKSEEEDALATRFASLFKPKTASTDSSPSDFTLPSVPSFAPAARHTNVSTNIFLASRFTEEEIDSWCIICTDDATLKCLGCDGDLYCQTCWLEGHRSESAGLEERRHKAVVFSKDGDEKKEGRRRVGVAG